VSCNPGASTLRRKSSGAPRSACWCQYRNVPLPGVDSIGKTIVLDDALYRVLGVFEKRKGDSSAKTARTTSL